MMAAIETDLAQFVRTPGGQVALLFVALTITYLLIVRFIRVSVPPHHEPLYGDEEAVEPEAPEADRLDADDDDVVPDYYRPEPVGVEPAQKEIAAEAYVPPEPPVRLEIRALQVGDSEFAVGDTASRVMQAFVPGATQPAPLIERGLGERAWHVSRTYGIGGRNVVLSFERESLKEPLRLIDIRVENAHS